MVQKERARYSRQNLEAAGITLMQADHGDGEQSVAAMWARAVLRHGDRSRAASKKFNVTEEK
jgi:hypothetical protein